MGFDIFFAIFFPDLFCCPTFLLQRLIFRFLFSVFVVLVSFLRGITSCNAADEDGTDSLCTSLFFFFDFLFFLGVVSSCFSFMSLFLFVSFIDDIVDRLSGMGFF